MSYVKFNLLLGWLALLCCSVNYFLNINNNCLGSEKLQAEDLQGYKVKKLSYVF